MKKLNRFNDIPRRAPSIPLQGYSDKELRDWSRTKIMELDQGQNNVAGSMNLAAFVKDVTASSRLNLVSRNTKEPL